MSRSRATALATVALAALWLLSSSAAPTAYYASPTGLGNGTIGNPWSLATALTSASVKPGDTVWLRGGNYAATNVTSSLTGTASARITVRQYPGERATLNGNGGGTNTVLTINGGYTDYWGFEVTNTSATLTPSTAGSGIGIDVHAPGTRLIGLVVHDNLNSGIGFWENAPNGEIDGCLIYYNGVSTLDHGIYTQGRAPATKVIKGTISHHNFGYGVQIYGTSAAAIDNFTVDGLVSYGNGDIGPGTPNRNFFAGGASVLTNLVLKNSCTYSRFDGSSPGTSVMLGYNYGAGSSGCTVTGNYFTDNAWLVGNVGLVMTGNTMFFDYQWLIANGGQAAYPSNTFTQTRPTANVVRVYPSTYEPGRGTVAVYNWQGLAAVPVDVSSILKAGDQYEVRNAANYYGPVLLSGTYAGGTLALPASGLVSAVPMRFASPRHGGNDFTAYVVIRTGAAPTPTPTPTFTPTVTMTPTVTPTPTPWPTLTTNQRIDRIEGAVWPTGTPTPGGR